MDGVSLVVCCHNSAEKLPPTIKHICALNIVCNIPFEIIIVDNASVDNTSSIAAELISPDFTNIANIVVENKLGLRNARLRGIAEAKYEYISFIDDDNWICPDWVNIVYEIMTDHPEVGACGGAGIASFESSPPVWFHQYQGCYAVGPQGDASGYVSDSRGYLWGAGLTIRRSAWDEIIQNGFTFTLSGRHGTNLSSGEDSEICLALRCFGWRLWYDERLTYYHYMPSNRLSWDHLIKLQRGFGASFVVLGAYQELINSSEYRIVDFHKSWISDSLSIIKSYRKRYLQLLYLFRENEGSPDVIELNFKIGLLWAIIRLRNRYDEIRRQIYTFYQYSKLFQERSALTSLSKSNEKTEVQVVDSLLLDERDEIIRDLQKRINDLESSLSWRLTAPLRRILDALRR